MISLANNNWEKSEVADNLSKQLFTKTNSQKKKKNRDRKKSQKSQSANKYTPDNADTTRGQISSLKKNLKAIKNKALNLRIDKSVPSSKKSPKKNTPESKPQITTSKQFFKSLKQKSLNGKSTDNTKTKEIKFSEEKNFQNSLKSPKNKKQKSPKNKQNEEELRNLKSNLSKKLKSQNKKGSKRKIVKLNINEKTKINVSKLEHLLKMNNEGSLVDKSQSLRERMVAQLRASRFRYLNEELYKNDSTVSKQMFKDDPEAFKAYHNGYQQQVNQWPVNPLDIIISAVKKMSKDWIIADFGCGEARLAASVPQKVHSIDLVAINDRVTACDMAHTPLLIGGVNVVIFCLSLMGTNLNDYLREANRVLKKDGILKIAEVESRFDNIDEFIDVLTSFGFRNTWKDLSHNLFYFMDFKKIADVTTKKQKLPQLTLKPCLYKKR